MEKGVHSRSIAIAVGTRRLCDARASGCTYVYIRSNETLSSDDDDVLDTLRHDDTDARVSPLRETRETRRNVSESRGRESECGGAYNAFVQGVPSNSISFETMYLLYPYPRGNIYEDEIVGRSRL